MNTPAHMFGGTCERCKHYHQPKPEHEMGECHENSPQLTYVAVPVQNPLRQMQIGLQGHCGWPAVPATESCSKWQANITLTQ